jgi:hypothetical protein
MLMIQKELSTALAEFKTTAANASNKGAITELP